MAISAQIRDYAQTDLQVWLQPFPTHILFVVDKEAEQARGSAVSSYGALPGGATFFIKNPFRASGTIPA